MSLKKLPILLGIYFGLALSAYALPLPPALLPLQQDGVFLTNGDISVAFQTNTETPDSSYR